MADQNAGAAGDEPTTPQDASAPADGQTETYGFDQIAADASQEADAGTEQADETETEGESDGESQDDGSEGEAEGDGEADGDESQDESNEASQNRRGFNMRNRAEYRQRITETMDELGKPATVDQLIEQGVDPALAEVEVLKAGIERDKVIGAVADLNATLHSEAQDVMREYPVFDDTPGNKQYDEKFSNEVEALYKELTGFQTDPTGKFVVKAGPLYKFYAAAARWYGMGNRSAARDGQRRAERMLAAAESPGGASQTERKTSKSEDPFLKGLSGGSK